MERGGFWLKEGEVKVLGLSGKARSGKDFLAKNVVVPMGFLPFALADHFKVTVGAKSVLSDGTRFDVDVKQLWETDKDELHRTALQEEGTERGRNVFGENIWVRHLELWFYKLHRVYGFDRFVVTDVRFPNEVEWIQSLGGKVYRIVGRGGLNDSREAHASEQALDEYSGFDRIIDNSPSQERYVQDLLRAYVAYDFGMEGLKKAG